MNIFKKSEYYSKNFKKYAKSLDNAKIGVYNKRVIYQ